jgi:hypothetical protein
VTTVAELADMPLGVFHNNLFPYASDQIVDDHGVRLGSLGSDIFQGDSLNEFWAVTAGRTAFRREDAPSSLPSSTR